MLGLTLTHWGRVTHIGCYYLYMLGLTLTHWGQVTHICVSDLTSIGSDNGLSPGGRQAIIRTNAGILLIRPLGTNFSEFLVKILIFSFKKMRFKMLSAKRRPFCLGLNELNHVSKRDPRNPFGWKLLIWQREISNHDRGNTLAPVWGNSIECGYASSAGM